MQFLFLAFLHHELNEDLVHFCKHKFHYRLAKFSVCAIISHLGLCLLVSCIEVFFNTNSKCWPITIVCLISDFIRSCFKLQDISVSENRIKDQLKKGMGNVAAVIEWRFTSN